MNAFGQSLLPEAACQLFDDAAFCAGMLEFESALSSAQAAEGLIPAEAAAAIESVCRDVRIDAKKLAASARRGGAMAVPLVDMLGAALEERGALDAIRYVHFGATTQDVVDTAQVLMTRDALAQLVEPLVASVTLLRQQAQRHARTPMLARTLLQPGQITSWGLKCASWMLPLQRSLDALNRLSVSALALQLGGATGNRSALCPAGERVAERMAAQLGLSHCPGNWHTQRDVWMRLGMEVCVLLGSISKVAKDLALLSQAEVGEVTQGAAQGPSGTGGVRGTSSAMPHKRNPVACMQAIAACAQGPGFAAILLGTMAQAHERGLGEWQAEVAVWPQLWIQAVGAAAAIRDALTELQLDDTRMRLNIERMQGLIHSEAMTHVLAEVLGKQGARALISARGPQALSRETQLMNLLMEDAAVQGLSESTQRALREDLSAACSLDAAVEPSARMCAEILVP